MKSEKEYTSGTPTKPGRYMLHHIALGYSLEVEINYIGKKLSIVRLEGAKLEFPLEEISKGNSTWLFISDLEMR